MFDAAEKPSLPLLQVPLAKATPESVEGYGCLIEDPENFQIEIVRRPALSWSPGEEGDCVESVFRFELKRNTQFGENEFADGEIVVAIWSEIICVFLASKAGFMPVSVVTSAKSLASICQLPKGSKDFERFLFLKPNNRFCL